MTRYFAITLSWMLLVGCNSKPELHEAQTSVINPKVMSSQGPIIRGWDSLPRETSNTGSGLGLPAPETRPALDPATTEHTDEIKSLATPTGGSLADPIRAEGKSTNIPLVPLDHDPATPRNIKNK